jgi:hypothetical protein
MLGSVLRSAVCNKPAYLSLTHVKAHPGCGSRSRATSTTFAVITDSKVPQVRERTTIGNREVQRKPQRMLPIRSLHFERERAENAAGRI